MSVRIRVDYWMCVCRRHHVPVPPTRLPLTFALGLLALIVLSGCHGDSDSKAQGPNTSADGLFPQTYSEQGFPAPLTLLKPTAATSEMRSYSFEADAGSGHPFALVASCTAGSVTVKSPGATAHRACQGGAMAVMDNCSGDPFQVTVRVTAGQRGKWGVAVYRMPDC